MGITYKETEYFCTINRPTFISLISQIEEILIEGRDNQNIPIYLTKYRIKTLDSLYLKTKRHQTDLCNITDCVGYRILCMFEEDIHDIHKFVVESLKNDFSLVEFIIYNYENEMFVDILKQVINVNFQAIVPQQKTRESGYKSIHYIFKQRREGGDYLIEIQLRTLFQDVWAELEHKLAYKQGNIHPHIKKSFELLAKDLKNKDQLISHLKSIRDQEQVGHLYVLERGGPVEYYGYEPELIPDLFKSEPYESRFKDYLRYFENLDLQKNKKELIAEAKRLYNILISGIKMKMRDDLKLEYFFNMEDAFFYFWEGGLENLNNALKLYEKMIARRQYEKHYMLYFRMGEIYFIKGEIVNALKSFDHCEDILINCEMNYFNHFNVKIKLSYIYWLLGQEYTDYSLKMIYDAEKIFKDHPGSFNNPERKRELILNNLCFYHLEQYLKTKDRKDFKELKMKLQDYESFMKGRSLNANAADTLAWTYYQIFLEDRDPHNLEAAKKYCEVNYNRLKAVA
jgi:ppGpp synthetase/RelA/SpoT-type nucleotidyltranferase